MKRKIRSERTNKLSFWIITNNLQKTLLAKFLIKVEEKQKNVSNSFHQVTKSRPAHFNIFEKIESDRGKNMQNITL